MKTLNDLKIGEWMPVPEGGFTVKLDEESYYSSENQDIIVLMSLVIKRGYN